MQSGSRRTLSALTSVRFFFALMVLVAHFIGHYPNDVQWPAFTYSMAPLAVSWFFMLSGFIISYNYPEIHDNRSRIKFMVTRIARIWPVHAVALTVAAYLIGSREWLIWHYTLTQTWAADPDISNAYNGPSWSVSNELFFYLAYVALVAPYRWLRISAVVAPITIGIVIQIMSGCLSVQNYGSAKCTTLIFEFPPARLIEFLAGVFVYHARLVRIHQTVGLALAIFTVFALSWIRFDNIVVYLLLREALIVIGGAALIKSLSSQGWLSSALSIKPLIIGGEISYAMYMTHQIINSVVLPTSGEHLLSNFLWSTSISAAISAALFFLVENPFRRAVKLWLASEFRRAKPLGNSWLSRLRSSFLYPG